MGYEPQSRNDIVWSRLPYDVQEWLRTHIDDKTDWKAIKSILRLPDDQLDEVFTMTTEVDT